MVKSKNNINTKQAGKIDIAPIRELFIQKSGYYRTLILGSLNIELEIAWKRFNDKQSEKQIDVTESFEHNFLVSYLQKRDLLCSLLMEINKERVDGKNKVCVYTGQGENKVCVFRLDSQGCEEMLDINLERIHKLLPGFDDSSDNSFESIGLCCDLMNFSYLILQSLSKINLSIFLRLDSIDQLITMHVFYLFGVSHVMHMKSFRWSLLSSPDLKTFHALRTKKSTKTKQEKRRAKESAVLQAYRRRIDDPQKKKILEKIPESKVAQILKDDIGHNLALSITTIKDILRKRDKVKFPFYPWEERKFKIVTKK